MFFFDDAVDFTRIADIGKDRCNTVGQNIEVVAHDPRLFEGGSADFIDLDVFSGFDLRLNLQQLGFFALTLDAGFQEELGQFRVRYGSGLRCKRGDAIQHGVLLLVLLMRLPGRFAARLQDGVGLYRIDLAAFQGQNALADKFSDILPRHASALGIVVLRHQSVRTVVGGFGHSLLEIFGGWLAGR